MKITECAYFNKKERGVSYGTCDLFPQEEKRYSINCVTFRKCEAVPISECPYKLYNIGKIDKEELNKRIMELHC